jgi:hypothetical protein
MKVEWKSLFIAMDISIVSIGLLVIFAINPMINAIGYSTIEQMSWNAVAMIILVDFFILTTVFYFVIYAARSKKRKQKNP